MRRPFRDRIAAAPLLPPRANALKLCRERFVALLDDDDSAAQIEVDITRDERTRLLLAGVVAHSPFLTRMLRRHPEWLQETLASDPEERLRSLIAEVHPDALAPFALAEAMTALRRTRQQVALHIALADLAGIWDVDHVVEALTAFADAAVDAALRLAVREAERSGRIQEADGYIRPERSGMIVLAMGKHGAGELNYSSDIDLIVLFRPEMLAVPAGREPLDAAVRITKDIVKILHEPTGSGYVFRTDLRLRPDPASTPIAVPVDRAVGYYQTVGQNWERAALIKARPVAGHIELGESFLDELAPFVWRRYFDYASIADIHAMKRQIHVHKGGETIAVEGHDVKLGRGGIREIEFFVQTQQLVFGGRKPALRGRRTLDMLERLRDEGWIADEAVVDLQAAYRFLRMVEHRLQMVEDQQTQRLPTSTADVDSIALFSGLRPPAFRKTLIGHFRAVERHYARLFEDAPGLAGAKGSLVFTGSSDDPDTLKTLKRMGFQRPAAAAEIVRGWHFGRRAAIVTPRAREVLTELVPALLEAFGQSSDPDGALAALDNALQGMPAVVELFTILRQNAALRGLFSEILGNAPRLAEVVVQRPHVLDALVDPEFAAPVSEAVLAERFAARLDGAASFEDFLDQIRDLVRAERFMIGARVLSGIIDPLDAGSLHAAVAGAAIDSCLRRAAAELAQRHGRVAGSRMAVLALGKLGGREMTALSDLDLMVLYDAPVPDAMSDGERPLYASEWHARLTQRLVTALTVATKRGTLYEVDLRLRPSGGKGPVAVALPAFRDYHAAESETWERMALTRCRVVAGDPAFGAEAMAAVRQACARPAGDAALAADMRAMRALVAKEKPPGGRFDLKLAPGGLVDIEFAAQAAILRNAAAAPDIVVANTGRALTRLAERGMLPPADADALGEAWRLQSRLAQLLALGPGATFDPRTARPAFRQRLAAAAELPDFATLERALVEAQDAAHGAMIRALG
jgi:[glutamine synthetase] adenylyltransferase / [glutamine synthetase]-adenylyl-L-tyrosine phosphorylase